MKKGKKLTQYIRCPKCGQQVLEIHYEEHIRLSHPLPQSVKSPSNFTIDEDGFITNSEDWKDPEDHEDPAHLQRMAALVVNKAKSAPKEISVFEQIARSQEQDPHVYTRSGRSKPSHPRASKTILKCPLCHEQIRVNQLTKHLLKAHPGADHGKIYRMLKQNVAQVKDERGRR